MSLAQFLLLGRLSTQSLSFVSNKVLKFLAIGSIGSGELPKELSENALHLTQQACVVANGSLEAFEWKALEQQENQGLVCGEDMLLPSNLSLLGFNRTHNLSTNTWIGKKNVQNSQPLPNYRMNVGCTERNFSLD